MSQILVNAPERARAGEIITIKVLIRHRMESGHRRDRVGAPIPRNIIHSFSAQLAGEEVFRMDLFSGIAANPFLEFKAIARTSGMLLLRWTDDEGARHEHSAQLEVT